MTAVGLLLSTSMMGCGPEGLRLGRSGRSSSPREAQTTPTPSPGKASGQGVATQTKAPSNRPPANEQIDAEVAPLHERIQKYVGRFPGDDLERKTGESAGQAAAPLPAAQERVPVPTAAQVDRPQASSLAVPSGTTRIPTTPEAPPPAPAKGPSEGLAPAPNAPTPGAPAAGPLSVEITEIRPAPVSPAGAPAPAGRTAPSANQPATPQEKSPPPTSLDALIGQLQQAVDRQPPEFDDQLKLRLLYLAAGQDDKAAGPVEGVDPMRAELLSAIVKTVAAARRAMHQPASSQAASSRATALGAADDLRRLCQGDCGLISR